MAHDDPWQDFLDLARAITPAEKPGFADGVCSAPEQDNITAETRQISSSDMKDRQLLDQLAPLDGSHICIFAAPYETPISTEVSELIKTTGSGTTILNQFLSRTKTGLRILELAPAVPHLIDPENPPWTRAQCMATIAFGMEATAADARILGLCAFSPEAEDRACLLVNRLLQSRPGGGGEGGEEDQARYVLDCLYHYGGREVAALAGAILAARMQHMITLIEGWSALAAFALLKAIWAPVVDLSILASDDGENFAGFAGDLGLRPLTAVCSTMALPGIATATAMGLMGRMEGAEVTPGQ